MIKSFQFSTGFPTAYPHLRNRKFEFTENLNILFGNVGSCKSTALKTMAAYSGISVGGWSSISEPSKLAYNNISHFPYCYRNYAPNKIDAIVEWGGEPSFFNDSESISKTDNTWFYQNSSQSADGITSEDEQMEILATKPSSGQYRIHKINKIMSIIKDPPDLSIVPSYIMSKDLAQLEVEYIKSLQRDGKVTILLDEPEKALSIPKTIELFDVLVKLSQHFQIIMATHSPFILEYKKINLIDFTPGYVKDCRQLIKTVGRNK